MNHGFTYFCPGTSFFWDNYLWRPLQKYFWPQDVIIEQEKVGDVTFNIHATTMFTYVEEFHDISMTELLITRNKKCIYGCDVRNINMT